MSLLIRVLIYQSLFLFGFNLIYFEKIHAFQMIFSTDLKSLASAFDSLTFLNELAKLDVHFVIYACILSSIFAILNIQVFKLVSLFLTLSYGFICFSPYSTANMHQFIYGLRIDLILIVGLSISILSDYLHTNAISVVVINDKEYTKDNSDENNKSVKSSRSDFSSKRKKLD